MEGKVNLFNEKLPSWTGGVAAALGRRGGGTPRGRGERPSPPQESCETDTMLRGALPFGRAADTRCPHAAIPTSSQPQEFLKPF